MTASGAWFEQTKLRLGWALVALVAGVFSVRAEPVISEIMASNTKTLADQNGVFSDWIELHNPEAAAVDLAGWYLADSAQTVEVTSGRVGAFALAGGSEDAALFVTLPPGAYTAEVRGKDGGEGVALLEIYVVP